MVIVIQNKDCVKDGEYNPKFEYDSKKDEALKKISLEARMNREKEIMRLRIKRLKNFRENMFSLDPGKYRPNWNAVEKRTPCVHMGEPSKNDGRDGWLLLQKDYKNYSCDNIKNREVENNKNDKNDIFIDFGNIDINRRRNSIILDKSLSNSLVELNKKLHNEESFEKEKNNMQNKFSKIVNNLSLPAIDSKTKIYNNKNVKIKKIKNSFSNGNLNNIRHNSPVLFNKMTGREQNLFTGNKNLLWYSPKYDSTRPHISSTIFKYHQNPQDYKKYKLNKIIRSYKVSSDYYVMELNREKSGKKSK